MAITTDDPGLVTGQSHTNTRYGWVLALRSPPTKSHGGAAIEDTCITYTWSFDAGFNGWNNLSSNCLFVSDDGSDFDLDSAPGCIEFGGSISSGGGFPVGDPAMNIAPFTDWNSMGVPEDKFVVSCSFRFMLRWDNHSGISTAQFTFYCLDTIPPFVFDNSSMLSYLGFSWTEITGAEIPVPESASDPFYSPFMQCYLSVSSSGLATFGLRIDTIEITICYADEWHDTSS